MASTAQYNKSADQHRRQLAAFELQRLREELKPQLMLTGSELGMGSDEVFWSHYTNTILFKLQVATWYPDRRNRQVVMLSWQAETRDTSSILMAIQQNLKAIQSGEHNHATHATG